jgi:hypothetical protein
VDDLLAQLAGEEIDRLLAEAEVERPAKAVEVVVEPPAEFAEPEVSVAEVSTAEKAALAPSGDDPEQLKSEPDAPTPAKPFAEADVEALDARVAKELDTLFTELNTEKPAATPVVAAAPAVAPAAPVAPEMVAAVEAAIPAVPADPVAHAQALERQVLGQTLMDALGGAETAEGPRGRLKSINFWFLLKPLEWLNAPLSACSDTFRESLGKVAIMTLVNALAILLYVLFLRKH